MRAVAGIEVNEQTLAFDLIKQAGPGGHFVSSRHTRRHMRSELYSPQLSDRENRDHWTDFGSKDAWARATEKSRSILDAPDEPVLSAEARETDKEGNPGHQRLHPRLTTRSRTK